MKDEIKEILKQCDGVVKREIPLLILAPEYTQLLLDYITNLQEAIETIKSTNKLLIQQKAQLQDDLDMLDNRIDKAIEYIKSNLDNTGWLEIGSQDVEVLLNILQGKSDE